MQLPRSALAALIALTCACNKSRAPRPDLDAEAPATDTSAPALSASAVEETAAPPSSFAPATLAAVRKGEIREGAKVAMEALLVPASVVHTSSTADRERYYILAVETDSAYALAIAELERDAAKLAEDAAAKLAPGKGKAAIAALSEIVDRLVALDKRLQELKPDPKSAVAVELQPAGLERVPFKWNTVVDECKGFGCLPRIPALPQITPISTDTCRFAMSKDTRLECLKGAEAQLAKLKAQDPPRLEEAMPNLPSVHEFDDADLVTRYNKLVRLFNAEVERRQRAQADVLPGKAARLARTVAAARGPKVTVRGVVAKAPDLCERTYTQTHGAPPAAHLRELRAGDETFAGSFYRKTRYCVSSYPSGAEITIRGEKVGKAPRCFDDLVAGEPFAMTVERKGYRPIGVDPAPVRPAISGVTEIECAFHEGEAEGGRCRILE